MTIADYDTSASGASDRSLSVFAASLCAAALASAEPALITIFHAEARGGTQKVWV